MTQAYILAGGLGTRLSPAIGELPKPLAPVAGKPFIYYPIHWLRRQGIFDITLCLGYRANDVIQAIGDGKQFGVRIYLLCRERTLRHRRRDQTGLPPKKWACSRS